MLQKAKCKISGNFDGKDWRKQVQL